MLKYHFTNPAFNTTSLETSNSMLLGIYFSWNCDKSSSYEEKIANYYLDMKGCPWRNMQILKRRE